MKSWMKSKSPSPASERSTPKRQRGNVSHAALFGLAAALLVSGCYVPPEGKNASSQFEATAPAENVGTVAAKPTSVTQRLTLDTPTPGWALESLFLYQVGDELWALHQLTPPDGMVAQMLSTTSTTFRFTPPSEPLPKIRHFVTGKTWKWQSNPEVTFLDSFDEIRADLDEGKMLSLQQPSEDS